MQEEKKRVKLEEYEDIIEGGRGRPSRMKAVWMGGGILFGTYLIKD